MIVIVIHAAAGNEKPAKNGFLASIGFGGQTSYVDEDN
jgi:hypothetical protein